MSHFRKVLNPQLKSVLEGLGCKMVLGTIMSALPADQIARKGLVSPRNVLLMQKMEQLRSAQKKSSRSNAVVPWKGS